MRNDFFIEKYGRPAVREWQQYAIIKCTSLENLRQYEGSIMNYYKKKQIDLNWKYIEWFLPKFIPNKSVILKIIFSLSKPFISKDDENFWPKDNPICKDKVFKIPMIRASSWKGALRYAAMRHILDGNNEEKIRRRLIILRLFGTEKDIIENFLDEKFGEKLQKEYRQKVKEIYDTDEPKLRGRLNFFQTFFENIGLDVIAPHDRKTRTVTTPILMEIVPENTKGEFYLLYYPFDLLEKLYPEKEEAIREIIEDWNILKEIISDMLERFGFGAKTSSGYGIAKIEKIEANGKNCGTDWNKVLEVVESE